MTDGKDWRVIIPINIIENINHQYPAAAGRVLNNALSRRIRVSNLVLLCLLSVFGITGRAAAEGNLHVGQLRIHPFFSVSDTVSDNIYNTAFDEKRDSFITYTPGLQLQLPIGRHKSEVQYYSVMNRYETYTGEDTTDNNASGLLDLQFRGGFGLGLSEIFVRGHEPRRSSSTGFIEKFKHNRETVSLNYTADRAKVQFDFRKEIWDFDTSRFRNRDESLFSGYLFYRFLPKTSAFIEFDRRRVAYDDGSVGLNSRGDTQSLGLRWEITEKSRGTVKAGLHQKDFKSPTDEDFKGWVSSIDLHHDFSEYTGLTINGKRMVSEANFQDTRYLVTTGAYAEVSYNLIRKVALLMRGSYGIDEFSNPIPPDTVTRKDRTSLGGLGLKYAMRDWLAFGFDYNHRTRHSNFPVNDYNEDTYIISIKMVL